MAKRHEQPCAPELFRQLVSGLRRHDIRKSRVGQFHVGDEIHYREHEPARFAGLGFYTGRQAVGIVSFISMGGLLPDGVCVLSVEVTEA